MPLLLWVAAAVLAVPLAQQAQSQPGNHGEALDAKEMAIIAAEVDIDAGLKALARGQLRVAQAAFGRAVEAQPRSAAAHYYYAYATYKIAEPKRPFHPEKRVAAEHFARAFELDPGFRPAWVRRD